MFVEAMLVNGLDYFFQLYFVEMHLNFLGLGKVGAMNQMIHQVWVQGENNLPQEYANNRAKWRKHFPGWEMILWDNEMAASMWEDYRDVESLCSHHAMRADLILARALRDFGGLCCGTDSVPVNSRGLLDFIGVNRTLVVMNPSMNHASNGLAYFGYPKDPFISYICKHQLRDRNLLSNPDVAKVTGPGCWMECIRARSWDLSIVTERHGFTRMWGEKEVVNPLGWIDPGFAETWRKTASSDAPRTP